MSVTLTLIPSASLGDRRQPGERRRDLDEQVRPVHQPPQAARLRRRPLGIRPQAADPPRSTLAHRGRRSGGTPDAECRRRRERPRRSTAAASRRSTFRGVRGHCSWPSYPDPAADRLVEDRRIGGDADDLALFDGAGQAARLDARTAEIVEPDGDPGRSEVLQCVRQSPPVITGPPRLWSNAAGWCTFPAGTTRA